MSNPPHQPVYDRRDPFLSFDKEDLEEIVVQHMGEEASVAEVHRMSGGFSNTNYKVTLEDERELVVRFAQRDRKSFLKEQAVYTIIWARTEGVPIPKPVASDYTANPPYAIFEYIPGESLEEILKSGMLDERGLGQIGSDLGRALAEIHSVDFTESGFFNEEYEFTHKFANCGEAFLDHASENLSTELARSRVPAQTLARVQEILRSERPRISEHSRDTASSRLVHADFNPKNILVDRIGGDWKVTGIIDWEFALSATPLTDLGNFLRFEDELPAELVTALVQAYEEKAGTLPQDWRTLARVLDVAAVSGFLVTPEDRPNTIRTANTRLDRLVANFK